MKIHILLGLMVSTAIYAEAKDPIDYVDPFIGTGYHGHTFPGVAVPHGMLQVSPDTRTVGWDACGGYHYDDDSIIGFSQTHFSGTGCTDLGDFLLMPCVGPFHLYSGEADDPDGGYRSRFSHASEVASPGYYKVDLADDHIKVELTASQRVAFHRYTFPESNDAHILLDLTHCMIGNQGTTVLDGSIQVVNNQLITGYRNTTGWAKNRKSYFAARFSKPFKSYALFDNETRLDGRDELSAQQIRSVFYFDTQKDEPVVVKMAISGVSAENALMNLDSDTSQWDFDKVHQLARASWNAVLGKSTAEGEPSTLRTFYTSLYHTLIFPAVYQDVNGEYRGLDQKIHTAEGWTNYTVFSLWDTFRALHPLYTLIQQEEVDDLVKSMMAHYEQNANQMLPIWSYQHNETTCMIGYHSVPVIADAYLKGLTDVDAEKMIDAFVTTSTRKDYDGLGLYMDKGYVPQDRYMQGASKTLAYAYDDWCIAKAAQSAGNQAVAAEYFKRSQNYRNVFDSETGFMRAKRDDGSWREPFDPHATHLKAGPRVRDYTEGNAWQWTWFVPHDVNGLIGLLGGQEPFLAKLDELFSQDTSAIKHGVSDVTGLIGEYAHGNEPSHHVAYLFSCAGAPWKTQAIVHKIMTEQYDNTPEGICGNEDCGQMSAWYVFSAMGFYPVNPCGGIYIIGKPALAKAEIRVGQDKIFTMTAKNLSDANIYIQSVKLNGKAYNQVWLTHDEIVKGGTLEFVMGAEPNKTWGTANLAIPCAEGK